jgi:hypothetical protein
MPFICVCANLHLQLLCSAGIPPHPRPSPPPPTPSKTFWPMQVVLESSITDKGLQTSPQHSRKPNIPSPHVCASLHLELCGAGIPPIPASVVHERHAPAHSYPNKSIAVATTLQAPNLTTIGSGWTEKQKERADCTLQSKHLHIRMPCAA